MQKISQLFESILDIDNIDAKSKPWLLTREFHSKRRTKTPKPLDAIGKPLQKGDMVIGVYGGQRPMVGIIIEIRDGVCAVCYTGDLNDMEKQKTASGSYRTPVGCYDLIKITPEIAEMIMDVK